MAKQTYCSYLLRNLLGLARSPKGSIAVMHLDNECFHSSIACRSDSLEPKLVVKLVNVKPSTRMGEPTQFVLQCSLAETDLEWFVERRYSEFRELLKILHAFFLHRGGGARSQCFGCAWFAQTLRNYWLPRRHLLCSRSTNVINQRRAELHQLVLILASHTFSAVPKCISCAKTIFPIIRDFFLRGATLPANLSLQTLEQSLQPKNFSPVSDPSKSQIEFRKARSVWKVLQMEKPVFSKLSEYRQQQKCRES
ncbi:PX domain-containing protein [Phytophthora infestans]|uniref:PX domain-containing protein n=1 Tax=Phytophthora infestans TaxID=4787 RepID=A0A833TQK5_PHYIN|nr:PX domain-containing protein [Phytophthora infestans]KAF4139390.1 PX domain-containing protein [Phytophthora infestans]